MKLEIQGIYETHLTVADLQRSTAFYQDVLGLTLAKTFDSPRVAFLWIEDKKTGMLGLWETGFGPLRQRLHFAFKTDLQTVLRAPAYLASKNIQPLGINNDPITEAVVIGWMPAVSVYFVDPDGHSLEFIHALNEDGDAEFGVRPYSQWLTHHKGKHINA